MKNLSPEWRGFLSHLGSYIIVIGALAFLDIIPDGNVDWFYWPAFGWGIGIAFHFLGTILGDEEDSNEAREDEDKAKRSKQTERPMHQSTTASQSAAHTAGISPAVQSHLDKAQAYQQQIEALIDSSNDIDTVAINRLEDLAAQVDEWLQAIESLARQVDRFHQDDLIRQDLETVPQAIAKLEQQLADETDPNVRHELERTLTRRKNQLASLNRLESMMKRAEIKIESTISSLGTIYSQVLTSQSTNQVADYSRLSAEADEEVRALQDHLEALEEVKANRLSL